MRRYLVYSIVKWVIWNSAGLKHGVGMGTLLKTSRISRNSWFIPRKTSGLEPQFQPLNSQTCHVKTNSKNLSSWPRADCQLSSWRKFANTLKIICCTLQSKKRMPKSENMQAKQCNSHLFFPGFAFIDYLRRPFFQTLSAKWLVPWPLEPY